MSQLEERLGRIEQQLSGPWTQANQNRADSMMDRLIQLEYQMKGVMEFCTKLYGFGYDKFEGDLAFTPPDLHFKRAKANVDNEPSESDEESPDSDTAQSPPLEAPSSSSHIAAATKSTVSSKLPSELPPKLPPHEPADIAAVSLSGNNLSVDEKYEYKPLRAFRNEVRVLSLRSSSDSTTPICCRLLVTSLKRRPDPGSVKFTTLSYTWGTSVKDEIILIDDKPFKITRSLYHALLHFRQINNLGPPPVPEETFWWIDAICINQEDVDERNHQITLMTSLYKRSKMTHVWLGEATDNTSRAIRLIEELGYEPPRGTKERANWEYVSKPGQTHRPVGPGQPHAELPVNIEHCSPEEKHLNRLAIFEFFSRGWFRRSWVRQDVALAGSITVHIGNESCAWDKMMKAATMLHFIADELLVKDFEDLSFSGSNYVTSCYELIAGLNRIRVQTGGLQKEYVPFENLFTHARDCESTDPKDKVFAMLPLTNPDKISILPDYRKDMKTIYNAAALNLARTSLDFLAACQNPLRDNGLPSWVPDLSIHPQTSKTPLKEFDRYSRSGKKAFMADLPDFQHEPGTDTLRISAIIFDKIDVVKDVYPLNYGDTEEKDWYNFWLVHRDKASKPFVKSANFMYTCNQDYWIMEFLRESANSYFNRNTNENSFILRKILTMTQESVLLSACCCLTLPKAKLTLCLIPDLLMCRELSIRGRFSA